MFTRTLVTGLLVLVSSFSLRAAPDTSGPIDSDTTDLIIKKDSLPAVVAADPKSSFREIPVEEMEAAGIALHQMHPLAIDFTEDYKSIMGKRLTAIRAKVQPQFHIIETIFDKYGLPPELKYLAIVESQLEHRARSHAGAVGPWQFMPVTARTMGLKVTKYVDERRDLTKSTHAAAKYLRNLYNMYEDWLLVIAAYNGGPGNVNSAIRRSGSRNFWELQQYLPAESRNHVKKYIATHFIMAGFGGLTTLTKDETERLTPQPVITDGIEPDEEVTYALMSRPISGRYQAGVITKHLMMELNDFLALNPGFDRIIANKGEYELRLPADKMELFLTRKPDILTESLQVLLQGANE